MSDLYSLLPASGFSSVLPKQESAFFEVMHDLNKERLADRWQLFEFYLFNAKKRIGMVPDAYCVYTSGCVVFRADLKDVLFPFDSKFLEFLPILVEGVDWYLVNCLRFTVGYDSERSVFLRSDGNGGISPYFGEIFMIQEVFVTDATVTDPGVFLLEDSNRAELLVLQHVKQRFVSNNVKGLDFKKIGMFEPDSLG